MFQPRVEYDLEVEMALQVRGICPKCRHVVETTAPGKRVTWRGTCPIDGCDGAITARRIKPAAPPTAHPSTPDGQAQDAPPRRRPRKQVVRIDGYHTPADTNAKPGSPAGDPGVQQSAAPDPGPAAPDPGPAAPDPGPAAPDPGPGSPPPGRRPRRSGRTETGSRPSHPAASYGYDL